MNQEKEKKKSNIKSNLQKIFLLFLVIICVYYKENLHMRTALCPAHILNVLLVSNPLEIARKFVKYIFYALFSIMKKKTFYVIFLHRFFFLFFHMCIGNNSLYFSHNCKVKKKIKIWKTNLATFYKIIYSFFHLRIYLLGYTFRLLLYSLI